MKKDLYIRIFFDILTSSLSWILFFYYRKIYIEIVPFELSKTLIIGTFAATTLWLTIYYFYGNYVDIRRISRLNEFSRTIIQTLIGTLFIFFVFIIDDIENYRSYKYYYDAILSIFIIHFSLTFSIRLMLANSMVNKIKTKEYGFNTIIIGNIKKVNQINKKLQNTSNIVLGYLSNDNITKEINIQKLGNLDDLAKVLQKNKFEEAIIAFNKKELKENYFIINELLYNDIIVKTPAKTTDILSGKVKMLSLFDATFIEMKPIKMGLFQIFLKRCFDLILSIFALIILSPILLTTSLLVKLSSPGPVFYLQERLGINKKTFKIIKFRSMYVNAEKKTPLLSSNNDKRITKWGKIMRKFRIDELPQFYNVLIGEMSIVGPRPERDFFAKQILKQASHYKLIYKVRPGITSWGMVKYGYAENVKEMVKRLNYDIIYLENLSLYSDFKVLVLTIFIILQGRGK
ncbi:MAG: polyprenyl glycosylphosphotransferase [Flavobacteriales bacterium]|nr:polyprenyl glycosylphosphotransferase [Flavobacteriales bacterium]